MTWEEMLTKIGRLQRERDEARADVARLHNESGRMRDVARNALRGVLTLIEAGPVHERAKELLAEIERKEPSP